MEYNKTKEYVDNICRTNKQGKNTTSSCSDAADTNFEEKSPSYADTTAACSACYALAPYSQLFVCLNEDCDYSLQQKVSILSPSLFYRREKVFCGACAFRGFHSAHKKYMEQAEPIAFRTASGEMGTKLQMEFDKFTQSSEDTAVGYFIIELLESKQLSKIRVVEYLSKSGSIFEWHRRVSHLHEALKTLNDFRAEGQSFVKDQADKLLTAYSNASKTVQCELVKDQPEKMQLQETRAKEHHRKMGGARSKGSDHSSFSSISSSSRKSSVCSVVTTSTVLQKVTHSLRTQAQVFQDMDAEVTGVIRTGSDDTNDVFNGKIVGEADLRTCLDLVEKFEMKRRFASLGEAVHLTAATLNSKISSANNKNVFIEYMEERFHIKWPRQIQ